MKKIVFLRSRWGAFVLLVAMILQGAEASKKRPNVVLIVSDDHRYDMISHKGIDYISTPHLDRLAEAGCSFENAFVTSGICSPSRASLLTGRYAHRASSFSILLNNDSFLENQVMFPKYLQDAGYRTGYLGKFHLGRETSVPTGFDLWASFPFVGGFFNEPLWINGEKKEHQQFTDYAIADLAASTIQKWSKDEKPFFLFIGLKAPHTPYEYPPELEDSVKGPIEPPASYNDTPPGIEGALIHSRTFVNAEPKYGSYSAWVETYCKSATSIDHSVGRVLEALEKANIDEQTLVIYTSDHGYSLGEHGLCEKHFAYEQVMRVPMIVKYPGIVDAGGPKQDMVLSLDVMPTILDWCGIEIPYGVDGKSWSELFAHEKPLTDGFRESFFFDFYHYFGETRLPAMQAIRTDRYKLIEYERKPYRELYDLKLDPSERFNRLEDPAYADVLMQMEGQMKDLKHAIEWSERQIQPLDEYYYLGALSAREDATAFPILTKDPAVPLTPLEINGKRFTWKHVKQKDNWFSLPKCAEGELFAYLTVSVERLSQHDPCYQLWSYLPGMETEENRMAPRIAGYFKGKKYFETESYAQWDGRKGFPYRFFNRFNPPLEKGRNRLLLRLVIPKGEGNYRFRIDGIFPKGTIGFSSKIES